MKGTLERVVRVRGRYYFCEVWVRETLARRTHGSGI